MTKTTNANQSSLTTLFPTSSTKRIAASKKIMAVACPWVIQHALSGGAALTRSLAGRGSERSAWSSLRRFCSPLQRHTPAIGDPNPSHLDRTAASQDGLDDGGRKFRVDKFGDHRGGEAMCT